MAYRLDFVDAVVLFALLKRGPQVLALELARVSPAVPNSRVWQRNPMARRKMSGHRAGGLWAAPASKNGASVSKGRRTESVTRSSS